MIDALVGDIAAICRTWVFQGVERGAGATRRAFQKCKKSKTPTSGALRPKIGREASAPSEKRPKSQLWTPEI